MDDFGIAIVGAIVGGSLTIAGDWYLGKWRQKAENEEHAHYLAIRLVCTLDPFIAECAAVADDDGVPPGHEVNDPSDLRTQVDTPELVLPADVDWKSIDHAFAYELLSFPNTLEQANGEARNAGWYGDPEDYFDIRQRRYIEIGLQAEAFAQRLRREYKLPARVSTGWDPIESINKTKAEFARFDEQRRAAAEGRPAPIQPPPPPLPVVVPPPPPPPPAEV